ncbi:leucine-rich repeat protein [Butyrivibrio sp. VCB2006]|uniref:leucine-rich repeat protein n=1 Tax=Butyrivibrio sp. VCB2006 TaxID=1280679 RepID=UPI000424129D|nr:leucine-rich repeat protein [Butyrivibrio sp. VCB2006]
MFNYEVKQDKKDNHEYIEITGYEGNVQNLVIPETIEGIKVEAIGSHAFSARQDIVSVSIPSGVRTLRSYVFHNSRNLKKISIYDSVDDYYDGVVRQCDSLEEVEITVKRGWFEVVRNFLADSDRAIRFVIHDYSKNGTDASGNNSENGIGYDANLSFPGYVYDFNENTMARTIQFSIAGAGYAYRECVDRRRIDYRQYDSLFAKAKIDGGHICQDIAIGRLLHPVELEDRSKAAYESYVRENGYGILKRFIDSSKDNTDALNTLGKLLEYNCDSLKLIDGNQEHAQSVFREQDIDRVVEYASKQDNPAITSLLMEKTRSATGSNDFSFGF